MQQYLPSSSDCRSNLVLRSSNVVTKWVALVLFAMSTNVEWLETEKLCLV